MSTRVIAMAILLVIGLASLAVAQTKGGGPQPLVVVIIDDGSFIPGVNPPGGVGGCWDATNQTTVNKVPRLNFECEGTIPCKPFYTCFFGAPSKKGCRYYKTHDFVSVGNCESSQQNYCHECPAGSEVFCMVYKMFEDEVDGVCVGPCNEWQVWFDGRCTD
jgi:hypothetical protein